MRWTTLDRQHLQLDAIQHSRESAGGTVVSRPSPLDIPEAIQVEVSSEAKTFVLRLKYITNEDRRVTSALTPTIQVVKGEASGRIYEIVIPVPGEFTLKSIQEALHRASKEILEKAAPNRGGRDRANTFRNKIAGQIVDRAPLLVTSFDWGH